MLFTADQVLGLPIPSEGPTFMVSLALHVVAALICVVTGALAVTAKKRPGRHPRSGTIYYWSLAIVFGSATVMAMIRWSQDYQLFIIGTVAFASATIGYLARRRRWRSWPRIHIPGMGFSYIALFTAFYVDNGPNLPVWNLLPHITYWLLPSVVGAPLLVRALVRRWRWSGAEGSVAA